MCMGKVCVVLTTQILTDTFSRNWEKMEAGIKRYQKLVIDILGLRSNTVHPQVCSWVLQRIQMTSTSATGASQSDLSSLTTAYQRIRKVIDLPQGGITNPMSISYDPTSMYRLMRALPSKFSDSEAASNPPSRFPTLNLSAYFQTRGLWRRKTRRSG